MAKSENHDIVHHIEQWLRNEPNAQEVIACRLTDGTVSVMLEYGDRTTIKSTKPTLRAALVDVTDKANTYPSSARIKTEKTPQPVKEAASKLKLPGLE